MNTVDSESEDSSESSEEEVPRKKKRNNQNNDNDVPNTEEFVEEKDLKQQDLTNDEMDQIRQQLEMMNKSNNIMILGSIALDSIETKYGKENDLLGGSATYATIAAGIFSSIIPVGIVGDDFPQSGHNIFSKYSYNLLEVGAGLHKVELWVHSKTAYTSPSLGGRFLAGWFYNKTQAPIGVEQGTYDKNQIMMPISLVDFDGQEVPLFMFNSEIGKVLSSRIFNNSHPTAPEEPKTATFKGLLGKNKVFLKIVKNG